MKRTILFSVLFLISTFRLVAQPTNNYPPLGSVFLGIVLSQPTGSFKKYYPGMVGIGGTLGFTVRPQAGYAPVELGTQVGYLPYGIEKHTVGTGANAYKLKTTHSFIPWHALVRLKSRRNAALNPYLDGLAGISIFNSRTKEKEDLVTTLRDVEAVVITKYNSTVFSYGLAAGLAFRGRAYKSFYGDIRLVYLENPLTLYVKMGEVQVNQTGQVDYNFSRSETSLLMVQVNFLGVLTQGY